MQDTGFWTNLDCANKKVSELKDLKDSVRIFLAASEKLGELDELQRLADAGETQILQEINKELSKIDKELEVLEFKTLLSGRFDKNNAIVSINAGAGGTESCDWVSMLFRMYSRWAQIKGFSLKVLDSLAGEEAGIKNITFSIIGSFAYGYLRSERGVHRLVRISPFDANKRRHTSFASVDVIPEIQDDVEIEINPADIRLDTYRSSGAGGQHVNVTDSAVRITHMPTGIVVQCQNERSQHQNKAVALNILRARLYERALREKEEAVERENSKKQRIEWGSQIRSYVMQPYTMVKDHRTGYETGNVSAVMDGELGALMENFLKWKIGKKK